MHLNKSSDIIPVCWSLLFFLFAGCAPLDEKGLIAGGQLNQAQIQCEKLDGPERQDCYSQLSRAYLDAQDIDEAVGCTIKAEAQIVFQDDFKDNQHGWLEQEGAEVFQKVSNGQYHFEHKREKGGWLSWPQTSVNLDDDRDFKIEVEMTKISGVDDHRYEVLWGMADVNNYFSFGVSGNGYYRYAKYKDEKFEGLTDWTTSPHIHLQNATNTLAVEKDGDQIQFWINGHKVLEKTYECGFGTKVGIALNQKMNVAVQHFTVTQRPSRKAVYRKILEGCLARGDFVQFIQHCEKAGYTQNEAYVRVAEMHLTKGDYEAAAINLQRAGWSVRDLNKRVLFDERFEDNRNKWFEQEDSEISYKVQNGLYHFNHKREKGGWYSWPRAQVNIDSSGDFKIQSTITKISGNDKSPYEIVWGMKDIKNCYTFGVNGNGSFLYGCYEMGRWKTLIDWTPSAHINAGNLTNTLAVEKSGDLIKLYVNDHLLAQQPYGQPFGARVGFSLNGQIAVEIDNLTVMQFAPQVAHALALKYTPADGADKTKEDRREIRRDWAPAETSTKQ